MRDIYPLLDETGGCDLNNTLLIKRGLLLEYLTLGWNVVGVILVILAAYAARSVALAGGKLTEGWAVFELKGGILMRIMGIFVSPPPHPALHLVSFHSDL